MTGMSITSPPYIAGLMLATAAAPTIVANDPGYISYVILGVFAGTTWRARYWWTPKGFQKQVCISDLSAILSLVVGGFGVCDQVPWIRGWTASTMALIVSIVGVDPLRKIAITGIDLFVKGWAQRANGSNPHASDDPPEGNIQ